MADQQRKMVGSDIVSNAAVKLVCGESFRGHGPVDSVFAVIASVEEGRLVGVVEEYIIPVLQEVS